MTTTSNKNKEMNLAPYSSLEEYVLHNHDGNDLAERLRDNYPSFFYLDETAAEIYHKFKDEVFENADIKETAAGLEINEQYIDLLINALVNSALLNICERVYAENNDAIAARPHALLINIVNKRRTLSYEDLAKDFNPGVRYDAQETNPLLLFRVHANNHVTTEYYNEPLSKINESLAAAKGGIIFHGEKTPTLTSAQKTLATAAQRLGVPETVISDWRQSLI